MPSDGELLSVRSLRRRWKPTKERLVAEKSGEATRVRIHRAFSWLSRAEQLADSDALDDRLIFLWIAFNTLYGQWDQELREPGRDKPSWQRFLSRVMELDAEGRIATLIQQERELILSLLGDPYLSAFFWQEPGEVRAAKSRKPRYDALTWYTQSRWGMILDRVMERVYLLRCQLVHGAASYGGTLNRGAIHRCAAMLQRVLIVVLLVIIDHGGDEDWGPLCYPPQGRPSALTNRSSGDL